MFPDFDRERHRIEGDLHDGVQQDLVATAVTLQLAVALVESDPAAARAMLEELAVQTQDALDRVRALAQAIYPSILPARGLTDALRSIDGVVRAESLGRYPLEVEEAVFFSCRGLAALGTMRVWEGDGALQFELVGDATLDEAAVAHASDRIASVGGQLTVSRGGTCVAAAVPVSPSAR